MAEAKISDRLRQLRKELHLSQTDFGARIGVGIGVIKNLEYGNTTPSDSQITLICNTFDVSRDWLLTGDGETFAPQSMEEEIAYFIGNTLSGDSDFKRRFIYALSRLDDAGWDVLRQLADDLSSTETKKEDRE